MLKNKKYSTLIANTLHEVIREEYTDEFGKFHRDGDLPAFVIEGVLEAWYINGKLHRDNNEAAIVDHLTGYKGWFIEGVCIKTMINDEITYTLEK